MGNLSMARLGAPARRVGAVGGQRRGLAPQRDLKQSKAWLQYASLASHVRPDRRTASRYRDNSSSAASQFGACRTASLNLLLSSSLSTFPLRRACLPEQVSPRRLQAGPRTWGTGDKVCPLAPYLAAGAWREPPGRRCKLNTRDRRSARRGLPSGRRRSWSLLALAVAIRRVTGPWGTGRRLPASRTA